MDQAEQQVISCISSIAKSLRGILDELRKMNGASKAMNAQTMKESRMRYLKDRQILNESIRKQQVDKKGGSHGQVQEG